MLLLLDFKSSSYLVIFLLFLVLIIPQQIYNYLSNNKCSLRIYECRHFHPALKPVFLFLAAWLVWKKTCNVWKRDWSEPHPPKNSHEKSTASNQAKEWRSEKWTGWRIRKVQVFLWRMQKSVLPETTLDRPPAQTWWNSAKVQVLSKDFCITKGIRKAYPHPHWEVSIPLRAV